MIDTNTNAPPNGSRNDKHPYGLEGTVVPPVQEKWLIVTIHGIRTMGGWQEKLHKLISQATPPGRTLDVTQYKYGYILAFSLAIPILRVLAARRFRSHLLGALQSANYSRIHIVAHSFGTYLACKALIGIPRAQFPRIHTILLAGSVLPTWFRWRRLHDLGLSRLINDCGTKDLALLASQLIPGLGMAGREGFRGLLSDSFCNRFFSYGHSDYFRAPSSPGTPTYLERYWLPLLISDDPPQLVDERPGAGIHGLITILFQYLKPVISVTWSLVLVVIVSLVLNAHHLRETTRALAIADTARSLAGDANKSDYAIAVAAISLSIRPSAKANAVIGSLLPLIPGPPQSLGPPIALDADDVPVTVLSPEGEWLGIASTPGGNSTATYQLATYPLTSASSTASHTCLLPTDDTVEGLQLSSEGRRASYIIQGIDSRDLEIFDMATCRSLGRWSEPEVTIRATVVSPDGKYLVRAAKESDRLAHLIVVDGNARRDVPIDSQFSIHGIRPPIYGFSCDSQSLIVANSTGTFEIIDLQQGTSRHLGKIPPQGDLQLLPQEDIDLLSLSASSEGAFIARRWNFSTNPQGVDAGAYLDVLAVSNSAPPAPVWNRVIPLKPVADPGPTIPRCAFGQSGLLTSGSNVASFWRWTDANVSRQFAPREKTPISDVAWSPTHDEVRVAGVVTVTAFKLNQAPRLYGAPESRDVDLLSKLDGDPITGVLTVAPSGRSQPMKVIKLGLSAAQDLQGPQIPERAAEVVVAGGGEVAAVWYGHTLCLFFIGHESCSSQGPAHRALSGPSGRFGNQGQYFAYLTDRRTLALSSAPYDHIEVQQPDTSHAEGTLTSPCRFWQHSRAPLRPGQASNIREVPTDHRLITYAVGAGAPFVITLERDDQQIIHVYEIDAAKGCTMQLISRPATLGASALALSENDKYLALMFAGTNSTEIEILPLEWPWPISTLLRSHMTAPGIATAIAVHDDGSTVALGFDETAAHGLSPYSHVEIWGVSRAVKYLEGDVSGGRMAFAPDGTWYSVGRYGPSYSGVQTVWVKWTPEAAINAACVAVQPAINQQQWRISVPGVSYEAFQKVCPPHSRD